MFKFKLGDRVKDRVTGFTGIVMSRTEWYNGCIRYTVCSVKLGGDGKGVDEAFDESQLEATGKPVPPKRNEKAERTGGPWPKVTQRTVRY